MVAALFLSVVYVLSSVGKLRSATRLESYLGPIAGRGSRLVARLVLICESTLAVALAASIVVDGLSPLAGGTSAAFLLLASAFHALLLSQGRPAQCHCFGDLPTTHRNVDAAWRPALFALRNAVLVAASATVAGLSPATAVATGGLVALAVAAGLLASIVRERRNLRREVHPLTTRLAPEIMNLQAHTWWVNGHPRAF